MSTPHFDGATYDPQLDGARLKSQLERVKALMLADNAWRTLRQIAQAVRGSEAGVSARLRDLKKVKFGSYRVERRRIHQYLGLWEYRVLPPSDKQMRLL